MIACWDVHYSAGNAYASAVVLAKWDAEMATSRYSAQCAQAGEYAPGNFYLRDLPSLLAVIGKIREPIDTYVIDGYCPLSADLSPGLGAHLEKALDGKVSIVGVAKSRYRGATHAIELLRKGSRQPLFITAIGVDLQEAARCVHSMAGHYRIPTFLKEADRLSGVHAEQSPGERSP